MKSGVTVSVGGIKVGEPCEVQGGAERGTKRRVERLYFYSICFDSILIFLY